MNYFTAETALLVLCITVIIIISILIVRMAINRRREIETEIIYIINNSFLRIGEYDSDYFISPTTGLINGSSSSDVIVPTQINEL
jgi:hypothetical protein